MTPEYWLMLLARWLHIVSATLAVGVPIYVRWVLMPAMTTLDEESRGRLREAIAARWRIVVYVLITIFLATGLYNFLVVARWRGFTDPQLKFVYHLYFGCKLLVALTIFFIASSLVGRSTKLAFIRDNPKRWLLILILLGLFIVLLSNRMRSIG